MVNRVFCYSLEQAKKTGNSFSVGKMVAQIFGIVMLLVASIIVLPIINEDFNPLLLVVITLVWMILIIWYAINAGFKMRAQLAGFATDDGNNLYMAEKLNNGEEFVIGGMAAHGIIDQISGNSDNLLGDAASIVGAAATLYTMNKSAELMRNPEIISRMVECAKTTTGAIVKQILKVHSITETDKKLKVNCDYLILRNGKTMRNKNITIYKTYNCFEDLVRVIESKK